MSWFGSRSLLLSLVVVPPLLGASSVASSEEVNGLPKTIPGVFVPLRSTGNDAFTSVAEARDTAADEAARTPGLFFDITYTGFTPEARAAFQFAADTWASRFYSPVRLTIDAEWMDLGPGVAGEAATTSFVRDFPHAPRGGTYYPVALASTLAGKDLAPGEPDITAEFNSTFDWYFGTDGKCPSHKTDLVSVVLHELGHGLGFTLSAELANGVGAFGTADSPHWFAFDTLIANGSGERLMQAFENPSPALGAQFISNDLFLAGDHTTAGGRGNAAKLYAPTTWHLGTSLSHLDEVTYPAGDVNSLMTPYINWAESVHDPGPITMGVFQDLGWPLRGPLSIATATSSVSHSSTGPDITVNLAGNTWLHGRRERRAGHL